MFFNISLSEGTVFKPLASPSPGVPAENADSQSPLQIDYFRITMDEARFPFDYPHTCDYAPKSLRTTSLLLLPVCVWNSSPQSPKWLQHEKATWAWPEKQEQVNSLYSFFVAYSMGQGSRTQVPFLEDSGWEIDCVIQKSLQYTEHTFFIFFSDCYNEKNNILNVGGKKNLPFQKVLFFFFFAIYLLYFSGCIHPSLCVHSWAHKK